MLKNVILDFGGVVCGYKPDDILSHFYEEDDRPLAKPIIYRDWASLDAGSTPYETYVEETLALLPGRLAEATQRFFRDWYKTMPPIEDTWALVGRLKARGYSVYLLSNAPTEFEAGMGCFPILKAFDGLLISGPLKMVKPNADIFEYLLKRYSLSPDQSLFVDDTPANVEGARRCGLHGFVFEGSAEALLNHIEQLS